MEHFLVQLGNMSFQASIVIVSACIVCFFFRKLNVPGKYVDALWIISYFCMIWPWRIERPYSFLASWSRPFKEGQIFRIAQAAEESGMVSGLINFGGNPPYPGAADTTEALNIVGKESVTGTAGFLSLILFGIWLTGFACLLAYAFWAYGRLKKRLVLSVCVEGNLYAADDIDTPFVLGIRRPKIFLPSDLKDWKLSYVVEHERTHIRRKDHLYKPAAFLITAVHWFNPFAWIAFWRMGRDMELSCDEDTLKKIGTDQKKDYARALLELTVGKHHFPGGVLAFGEKDIKGRLQNIMRNRKPLLISSILAVLILCILSAVFLSYKKDIISLEQVEEGMMLFPKQDRADVVFLTKDGKTTKFPPVYHEIFLEYLKQLEVEREPAASIRSGGTKESGMPAKIVISFGEGPRFCFSADGTVVWCDNGVKPSFPYKVEKPKEVLDFLEMQLESMERASATASFTVPVTAPAIGEDMPVGVEGPLLDYADEDRIIFHDYCGLFVYSMKEGEFVGAVALKPIGCQDTQGENACEVFVAEDGSAVYLHPMTEKEMYVYRVEEKLLTRQEYDLEGIAVFGERKLTQDCIDPKDTFCSFECVEVHASEAPGGNCVLYLESESGLVMDLRYVKGIGSETYESGYFFDSALTK